MTVFDFVRTDVIAIYEFFLVDKNLDYVWLTNLMKKIWKDENGLGINTNSLFHSLWIRTHKRDHFIHGTKLVRQSTRYTQIMWLHCEWTERSRYIQFKLQNWMHS